MLALYHTTRQWHREQDAERLEEQAWQLQIQPAVSRDHAESINRQAGVLRRQAAKLREPEQLEQYQPPRVTEPPRWVAMAMAAEPA